MGDQPVHIGAVAADAAAEMVIDAAAGHVVECHLDGIEQVGFPGAPVHAKHQVHGHAGRKLVVAAAGESAAGAVEVARERGGGAVHEVAGNAAFDRRGLGRPLREEVTGRASAADDFLAVIVPGARDAGENLHELLAWEIGSGVKGFAVGCEPDAHRPAAVAGKRLRVGHVNLIDVGTLLAVHLDADVTCIERGGHVLVFEGFMFHDMAPVAGGVTDGEEDQLVLVLGLLEGFVVPFVPVDGVMRVLQQVRTRCLAQAIGKAMVGRWGHRGFLWFFGRRSFG